VSVRVLIIPEDFRKDQFILRPVIVRMLKHIGVRAKVEMCWTRLAGVGEALKWDRISEILDDNRNMVDLFLLIVDRDCKESRRQRLDNIEAKAKKFFGEARSCLIAENAWQEVEVWVLAGMPDLPREWAWAEVRAECDPKETYYDPFAEQRGVCFAAAEGRDVLGKEAAANYKRVRALCPDDIQNLETRIRLALETGQCP
jgi:hypothetical protein